MPFPSNSQYTPILVNGTPLFDVLGDESPVSTDIVGNSTFPAGFFAYDGTNVYFRLRLNGDPRNSQLTGFRNFAWGVLINTTGVSGTYDWLFNVDGLNNRVSLIQNTVKLVNSWNDPAEGTGGGNPNFSQNITNFDYARVTQADSSIGGDQDYFLDWFLPSNTVFSLLGINAFSLIRAIYFSSANNNNYNKDSLRTSEGFSFTNAISNPVTPNQADVRAGLSTSKTINSGPNVILLGQSGTWTGTITVSNTGQSQATTIFAEDVLGPDIINFFTISSVSQGLTSYNSANQTLTWNVGNLAPGASATLTFTVSGVYTASGTRNIDRVQAFGFDSFSGNAIQSNTSAATVNVQQASTINGTISDQSTGLVLPNTTVNLFQGMVIAATVQTNANGFYSFTNVTPGSYAVQAVRTNYITGTQSVTAVSDASQTVNIALVPQPSTISGTVSNGGPINGALVTLSNTSGAVIATETTSPAGIYTFNNVIPGVYNLAVTAAGFQSQTASVMPELGGAAIVNFLLAANPGTITGTIRNASNNTPIGLATVELLNANGIFISSTTADGTGQYTFGNLASGNYQIRAFAPNYGTIIAGSTVTAGNTTTTNIYLIPDSGSLQGLVMDSETMNGIPDATVQVVNSQNIVVASVLTEGSGQYSVGNLLPGSHSLIFLANGYSQQTLGAVIVSNQISTVNAQLARLAGTLSGIVNNPALSPIPNALVAVYQNGVFIKSVVTDENGAYMISGLSPGSYTVVISAENYAAQTVAAMITNGETTVLNITLLEDMGVLTGFVRDENNNPITGGNVTVQLSTGTGIIIAVAATDSNGQYTVIGLAPGNYTVVATAVNYQSSSQGTAITANSTSTVNFFLAADPGSITGTITNANTGAPVAAANVQVRIIDASGAVIAAVLSDSMGDYIVTGLAPGVYTVIVSAPNFQTNAATVQVQSNQAANGNVALVPDPGQITGTIISSIGGTPIAGAVVNITSSSGSLIASVLTDQNGIFMAERLAPDHYTLNVFADNFQNGSVGALVQSGQSTPVIIELAADPGRITGTVSPAIPNTVIQLRDVNNFLVDSALAASDGSFSFNNLAPGLYTVLASATSYSVVQAGTFVQSNQTSAVSLTMVPNPGSISGVVTDNLGNPIVNSTVQVYDQNGILMVNGFSNASGEYIVGNLPSGSFTAVVNSPGYGQVITGVSLGIGQDLTGVNVSLIPNPGTINGQITDRGTGEPVSGASVVVLDSISQFPIAAASTTVFGNYTVTGLAPGSYIVSASKIGYSTEQVGAIVESDISTAADIALQADPGRILGSVVDSDGNPVTGNGIQISVYNENQVLVVSFIANSDGSYFVPSLAPGAYFVTASAPNFSSSTVSAIIDSNQTTPVMNVLLPNPVSLTAFVYITGTIIPISGAAVSVRHSSNIPITVGITDDAGMVSFNNLPAGTLNVTADAVSFGTDSKSVIGAPGDLLTVELGLAQNPGQIQGFVSNLDNGNAISNAVIQLYDFTNVLIQSTVTNTFGEYTFSGVSPGVYTIIANAADFGPETAGAIVSSKVTSTISFALRPNPGIIQGFVRNVQNNLPIADAAVEVRELSGTGPIIFTTVSDENGFFQSTALSPRVYVLIGSSPEFGSSSISAEVTSGTVTTIEILLTSNPGSIQGTVMDAVTLEPLSDTLVRIIDSQGVVIAFSQTTPEGRYEIDGLSPGSYTISAVNPNYQAQFFQMTVEPNSMVTVNFNLQGNPAVLSGIVFDSGNGAPLTGAIIEVFLSGTEALIRRVLTDENGRYLIQGLPQGVFDVQAQFNGYVTGISTVFLSAGESENLNFELTPFPAEIRGSVVDAVTSSPIPGALIRVVIPNTDIVIASIITSSDGSYLIGNLPSGSYNVVISAVNFSSAVIPIILSPNESLTVDASLDPDPAAIFGTVRNADTAAGIEGALVRVFTSSGTFITSALTDLSGRYTISQLGEGQYTVIASAEEFADDTAIVTLDPGESELVDFFLNSQAAGLIGIVRDSVTNVPIQSALVQVFRIGTTIPIASVLTNGEGEYVIEGLVPREYRAVFNAEGYANEVFRIVLSDGEMQMLNALLQPQPASIRGRVTDASTGEPVLNAGVVTVISGSGIIVAQTLTDEEGNYILSNLQPRTYNVIFSAEGYVRKTISVVLAPNETTVLNTALESSPAAITGNVRDSASQFPIGNVLIQVFLPSGILLGTTLTDQQGNYSISGLPAGTVEVIARALNYQSQFQNVTLTRGSTVIVNFLLEENPASVSGFVTDDQTGQPIAQALVQIFPNGSNVPIRSTLTDSSGFYALTGLPPGTFDVRAQFNGYVTSVSTVFLAAGEREILNFELSPFPAEIRGSVVNAVTEEPIPGALVRVIIPNTDIVVGSIITSSDGSYSIGNLPAGNFNVVFSAENFSSEVIPLILAPNEAVIVNALLEPNPAAIFGTVRNALTSAGIEGALVRVFTSGGIFITSTLTDLNGSYSISQLGEGQYTVIASASGFGNGTAIVTLVPGESESVNFTLTPQSAGLRGRVRDSAANAPIQSALVQVFRIGTAIPIASVLTNGEGEYLIEGLDPREYRVVFSAEGYANEVFRIVLSNGEMQIVNALLQRQPASIRGRVTDASTGEPILNAAVITVISGSGIIVAQTLTDEQGNYILSNLPPGPYNVIFSAEGYVRRTLSVALSPNESIVLNAALESNPASLTGNVREAESLLPVANALIQVFLPSGTLLGTTLTDFEGNYSISGLPAGPVEVIARASGYQSQFRNVTLSRGSTVIVNFLLEENPASVSGVVTDNQTGQPLSQVLVQIFPLGSDVPIRSTLTDPAGFYALTGLPPGTYIVRFTAEGYESREIQITLAEGQNLILNVQLGGIIPPPPRPLLSAECISVEKVFDWVMASETVETKIMIPQECRSIVQEALLNGGVDVKCKTAESPGSGLTLLDYKNGTPGSAKFRGIIPLQIKIDRIQDNRELCSFGASLYFVKTIALCLPEGLDSRNIHCSLLSNQCSIQSGSITDRQLSIRALACVEIEVVAPVIMEVMGKFCFPRENLLTPDNRFGSSSSCRDSKFR
ncbi:carboxypeptidase regulatory-like domain-containing protein [Cytobacillus oceanisediminis]|uniref:carboxypeptidase regulatory-like domain-containing protein n=1 Tax=Cytobacillus oceanisediminis TaxID=665099 RepID=UPI002079CE39|nr:carboxypeptidase regulatory-like domain-containing protein [Cytobacillus oceanisediminis]USK42072.1 carboxypeptidase regulatory-like domain-containing protein [Cytobacillus oceanisediminis]